MEKLCEYDAIGENSSKAFRLGNLPIFVVHKEGNYHAYINWCPHLGVSLNYEQNQFLDSEKTFIVCANHGALFDIASGACFAGPCTGKHLLPIPCEAREDGVYIGQPENAPPH